MAPTDSTDRITFWQDHVIAWQVSDLTQKAYCEQQELRYSTFGYWVPPLCQHHSCPLTSVSNYYLIRGRKEIMKCQDTAENSKRRLFRTSVSSAS